MATIWLIRHGQSHANAGLATVDSESIHLTDAGHQQAQRVAAAFKETPAQIISSPFVRARQTARPTLERFAHLTETEWPVEEFSYLASGHFQNSTVDERRPASHAYWRLADPFHVDGEGAESFAAFIKRVRAFRERLRTLPEGLNAIFTHERFIQAVLWNALADSPPLNAKTMLAFRAFSDSFSIPNGGLIEVISSDERLFFSEIRAAHLQTASPTDG